MDLQILLLEKFAEAKVKNPSYSLRAFSRKLGLSSGALSQIMGGKRPLTYKSASLIVDRLGLGPKERDLYLGKASEKNSKEKRKKLFESALRNPVSRETYTLKQDEFLLISDLIHFTILALLRTKEKFKTSVQVATRLGKPVSKVDKAVKRLERLGLMTQDPKGHWIRSDRGIETSDDVSSVAVRKAHEETLDAASEALNQFVVDERDFTSVTLVMSQRKLPLLKNMIRNFQDQVDALVFEESDDQEVYSMNVQVFPVTKRSRKN